jgi:serine/threonine-protein kinase
VSEDVPEGSGGTLAGFRPGSRIAGYVLEELIGAGGMAVVFRAHDERLDRQVALKILAPALAADQAFRLRFIRESRAAAAVDDPHIIPVFDAGESDGVLFIAMRYVRGGDVRSLLAESGPLPLARVAEIVSQVSTALDAAHERGLVHRDVKPANMLLDSRAGSGRPDHVYLSDFGLSKGTHSTSGLTNTGTFLGTVDYISPEQIEGKPVDGRADQYALACAAFELLTGAPPFRRDEPMAVMYAQLSQPAPSVTSSRPDLPAELDEAFARALAKAPDDRWARCTDFAVALRSFGGLAPSDTAEHAPDGSDAQTVGPPTKVVTRRRSASDPGLDAGAAPAAAAAAGAGVSGGSAGGEAAGSGSGPHGTTVLPGPKRTPAGADQDSVLTQAHSAAGDEGWPGAVTGRQRPAWRSPAALAGAVVVLLAVGGGGVYLASQKPSGQPGKGTSATATSTATSPAAAAFLSPPGCGTTAAAGKPLTVSTSTVKLQYGIPYDVAVSRDGKYVFATNPLTLSVLTMNGNQNAAAQYHYYVASSGETAKGVTLTSDGKFAAVAVGNQVNIQSATAAEQDASSANAANLIIPRVRPVTDAYQVALTPDDRYAFVTMRNSNKLAVFNMHKALVNGQTLPGVFLGTVTLGIQPTGLAVSPDGLWLYVASAAKSHTAAFGPSEGLISVLSVQKLETNPGAALVGQAPAGCGPAGVAISSDGTTVWVTAQASNELLGFSAAKLRTDPQHALTAAVPVGQTPTGLILVDGGSKIIVADSNLNGIPDADNLAVVDVAAAIARKPALIGYLPSGPMPLHFALSALAPYLYVADGGAAQLEILNIAALPAKSGT